MERTLPRIVRIVNLVYIVYTFITIVLEIEHAAFNQLSFLEASLHQVKISNIFSQENNTQFVVITGVEE